MNNNNRTCGDCRNHDPVRRICLINLSYAAFVDVDAPANDCPAWERPKELQAQSECRPVYRQHEPPGVG